jgi:ABC-type phosphate transport system substrate-binding protein
MRASVCSRTIIVPVLAVLAMTLLRPAFARASAEGQLVVITSPQSSLRNVTMEDLKRLYLGESRTLATGQDAQLVEYGPARQRFYERVARMSETLVKRRWIALVFAGESVAPPREFQDAAELRRFVNEHPNAIAFISYALADASVKILAVDGRQPTDSGYPLR